VKKRFNDVSFLLKEVGEEESLFAELLVELNVVEQQLEELEIKKMLSGELDGKDCYLSINAGAGGTESCDWVQMLLRMYQKWAVKKGWKVEVVSLLQGEVAGVKSVTLCMRGACAYGYCKAEKGIHRLVRISPFDTNAKRHTSFAAVEVVPKIDETIAIDIKPDDIRVETFRSSGPGGQHVNTTDSAVRITHLPSGIVVSSQKERSQSQNKDICFDMLRSLLYERERLKREGFLKEVGGEKRENAWGSQNRSYFLQPHTRVKDKRTNYEESNIQKVLDGDIDAFVHAYLKEVR